MSEATGKSLGPTVVRHDADLEQVTAMKRGDIPNDGTLAEVPARLVPNEFGAASRAGDGIMPTTHLRRDLGEFQSPFVEDLRDALNDPRIGGDWGIVPTPLGNLALLRQDPGPLRDMWYAGYIDLVTGDVVLYDGDPEPLPRLAQNYPFRGAVRYVDGLSHEATLNELRATQS